MRQALQYFFSEAGVSLWRRRRGALLAILTIASGLFILGLFLLITTNGGRLVQQWTDAAELSIFLRDDVTSGSLGTEQVRARGGEAGGASIERVPVGGLGTIGEPTERRLEVGYVRNDAAIPTGKYLSEVLARHAADRRR